MDHWAIGERGDRLYTDGVDACIAVALSNGKTGKGFLGHFSPDSEELPDMIAAAQSDAASSGDVQAWYGGAAMVSNDTPSADLLNREMTDFRRVTGAFVISARFKVRGRLWLPIDKWLVAELTAGSECRMRMQNARS